MKAGDLRSKINFYRKTTGKDQYGGTTENYIFLYSVRAKIHWLRGDEILLNSTTANITALQFIIRSRSDITEEMEIEYAGARYNIEVIEVAERSMMMKLTASKLVNIPAQVTTTYLVTITVSDEEEEETIFGEYIFVEELGKYVKCNATGVAAFLVPDGLYNIVGVNSTEEPALTGHKEVRVDGAAKVDTILIA